jgi:hypothetical protein
MRLNNFATPSSYQGGNVAMDEKSDREELQRRLGQATRLAAVPSDPVTIERLQKLVQDLEEQLRKSE